MLEKSELRDALTLARAADLPSESRLSGEYCQLYFAAGCAAELRHTTIVAKPMRGAVERHFIGEPRLSVNVEVILQTLRSIFH
jgi:hypothetical protein